MGLFDRQTSPRGLNSRGLVVIFISVLSSTAPVHAQDANQPGRLHVETPGLVSGDRPDLPHVEPVLAVNPADPNHLVVAAIVVREPHSDDFWDSWFVDAFLSEDGGATWRRQALPQMGEEACLGDPWLAWAPSSALYLSCLAQDRQGDGPMRAWLFRSVDGGRHWDGPANASFATDGSLDHPVLYVLSDSTAAAVHLFATGAFSGIGATRSNSHLDAFDPRPIYTPDSLNNNLGSGVAFPDGEILFSYFSMSGPMPAPLWAVRSTPGATTYERSLITQEHVPVGFPMMAANPLDDAFPGRVYSTWVRSETNMDVNVNFSDDGGETWSTPVVVHRDSTRTVRAIPQVAVNDRGVVAVGWVDGRHHEGDCWDVYATMSLDGGRSFLPETRLTPETSCPGFEGNGGAARRWRWGGDYFGIAPAPDGRFLIAWSDNRTGVYQIWTTTLHLRADE